MKFTPCTDECTSDGDVCRGCGRSHTEIRETKALVKKVVGHMMEYQYDNPDDFLKMLTKKSSGKFMKLQGKK